MRKVGADFPASAFLFVKDFILQLSRRNVGTRLRKDC